MTKVYKGFDVSWMKECWKILKNWWLVAFPTETVYWLWADALSETACQNIYKAKWRPSDNPLIVHICDEKDLNILTPNVSLKAKKLIDKFWPGPLTLVFEKLPNIPKTVSWGLDSIAVRMPWHQIALDLIKNANTPIAAPSANTSWKPSPTSYEYVLEDLDGKIDAIIDGWECEVWIESTVLDLTTQIPVLLRPWSITKTQIENIIWPISYFTDEGDNIVAKSPWMKYKHYSPDALIIWFETHNYVEEIKKFTKIHPNSKILTTSKSSKYETQFEFIWDNSLEVWKKLFSKFRDADRQKLNYLIVEPLWKTDDWEWVRNRLKKATNSYIL